MLKWIPSIVVMAIIYYLSSKEMVSGPSVPDYVVHFVLFGILAAAYHYALSRNYDPGSRIIIIVFIMTSIYGLTDEFHQSFVPGRQTSLKDWLVDSFAGITIPAILYYWNRKRRLRFSNEEIRP